MAQRKIDYLRLSVTDRCNLNCVYCTPLVRWRFLNHSEVLRYEEMARLVKVFVGAGVRYVRITGGEPLIKKDITDLVKMLKAIKGLEEVSMTTNGVYLRDLAFRLKLAGLDRINISIDTLVREKYSAITGTDSLEEVLAGVHEALRAGLHPVKLNVVVLKGINDDEVLDFARLALKHPLNIRFVELFPTGRCSDELICRIMENAEIKKRVVRHLGKMRRVFGIRGNGPAEYYRLGDSRGLIGFINGFSGNFCGDCNRIRLDCAGRISPCLFSGFRSGLREILRSTQDNNELSKKIKNVFKTKPLYNKNRMDRCKIEMSSIGG